MGLRTSKSQALELWYPATCRYGSLTRRSPLLHSALVHQTPSVPLRGDLEGQCAALEQQIQELIEEAMVCGNPRGYAERIFPLLGQRSVLMNQSCGSVSDHISGRRPIEVVSREGLEEFLCLAVDRLPAREILSDPFVRDILHPRDGVAEVKVRMVQDAQGRNLITFDGRRIVEYARDEAGRLLVVRYLTDTTGMCPDLYGEDGTYKAAPLEWLTQYRYLPDGGQQFRGFTPLGTIAYNWQRAV